jgi:hypothetical protein
LTIWEGTSFIHANDLIGRKMRMKEGAPFARWLASIKEFIDANMNASGLEKEMQNLSKGYQSLTEVKCTYDSWWNNLDAKRQLIPLNALRALFVCSQVFVAQCLAEQALIASQKLTSAKKGTNEAIFYEGKIASARYYLNNILPQAFLTTELIKSEEDIVLTCPEESLVVN